MFKKFLVFLMTAVIAAAAFCVTAGAEDLFDGAKTLTNGKKTSTTLAKAYDNIVYKAKVSQSGTLTLKYKINSTGHTIHVYNNDGGSISIKKLNIKAGEVWSGGQGQNEVDIAGDRSLKMANVEISYAVKKGTYFIKIERTSGTNGSGELNLTPSFPSNEGSSSVKFSNLTIRMDKGDTLKLGMDTQPSDAEIKWSSSKETVAAVSESGKVSAKKVGTAIITAKSGNAVMEIKIIVE